MPRRSPWLCSSLCSSERPSPSRPCEGDVLSEIGPLFFSASHLHRLDHHHGIGVALSLILDPDDLAYCRKRHDRAAAFFRSHPAELRGVCLCHREQPHLPLVL